MNDFSGYLSPYSWRYGTPKMRSIWSEEGKRRLWRKLWVALARVESEFGLIDEQLTHELEAHAGDINLSRSFEIEEEIRHDLMAEVKTFAEQCPNAGGIIHLGATSMDIEDNADALRMRDSLKLIIQNLKALLNSFVDIIMKTADMPIMAFTHIQPAEPTTFGYRCAMWAQDLLINLEDLERVLASICGKGFKGAVGTASSYSELIGTEQLEQFERRLAEELGIQFFPIATQTYTRLQDYRVIAALAGMAASLHKMAFDLRILQSPPVGEVSEPFGSRQVGSSAMPFKRNPIDAEKIDSLARLLSAMPQVAWGNASLSLLERTLDDSANRRTLLPESFLIADELLKTAIKIFSGLVLNTEAMQKTFSVYAPFACTERIMMALAKKGADRQVLHEKLREHALHAWAVIKSGQENPLFSMIQQDSYFTEIASHEELASMMDVQTYVGNAPERARKLVQTIQDAIRDT